MCVAGTLFAVFCDNHLFKMCSWCEYKCEGACKSAKMHPFCSNQLLDTEIITKKQLFLPASAILVALGAKGCLFARIPLVELFTLKISVF
ncbi:hypothetical protein PAECIP111891_02876 [Paenibacillus allorhizoplanae]|uniref:Uncharacterized protein n=1 Tax=Paenibacillus allorhizoplanae TaxID=2905648 RepID=A0ABM9CAP9_9BACL|nr:hypothetical protein PAECIP111891_02876 [Paenibacillus allorhizoplanae]